MESAELLKKQERLDLSNVTFQIADFGISYVKVDEEDDKSKSKDGSSNF